MENQRIQKDDTTPLQIEIKIFKTDDNQFPYVVEFKKGVTCDKFALIDYFNEMREKCFKENENLKNQN